MGRWLQASPFMLHWHNAKKTGGLGFRWPLKMNFMNCPGTLYFVSKFSNFSPVLAVLIRHSFPK